jgi:hypothetical protein
MIEANTMEAIQPPKKGGGNRAPDDLICWLHAIHVCHVDAGDSYDRDGYLFFFSWYCDLVE